MAEVETPPARTSEVLHEVDTGSILGHCCRNRTPALILIDSAVYEGQFVAMSESAILFDMVDNAPVFALAPRSVCSVTFVNGDRSKVFISTVNHYDDNARPPRLSLRFPEQLCVVQGRISFRIPVLTESELEVEVSTGDGRRWVPEVKNISLSGTLVKLPQVAELNLTVGSVVMVELRLGGKVARLWGKVRRRQGAHGYALMFSEILSDLTDGQNGQFDSLRAIVNELEQRWLKSRLGAANC